MGSIWKAVTSMFKKKMEEERDDKNEGSDGSDDSDDEDFVPANETAQEEVSEEDDEGDDEDSSGKKGKGQSNAKAKKRKRGKGPFKGKRRKVGGDSDDDDEEDVDFIVHESHLKDDEDVKGQPKQEDPAQDALEKEHTDRLWADFLTSVNDEKEKKGKERTVEKVVSKVYDFAGEKVEVQEKVRVTVAADKPPNAAVDPVSNVNGNNAESNKTGEDKESSTPGSSTSVAKGKSQQQPFNGPRRGGISILGNDPEAIGLDELEKRGLSGLLKAFQSKTKKIGTLEKSKLDWEEYKRKQGLEEELQHHNKSRDTFIDKQEFLQRTDHRQFEIEKSMRATARSKRLSN